jgi:bifunctional DNA-binding transcriptional regulator/antitoxin component of YhaV-PrlF toxin-antitoxin module
MRLVKVRRFAQVTIPVELQEQPSLAEGDSLEAEAAKDEILRGQAHSEPGRAIQGITPACRPSCPHPLGLAFGVLG